MFDKKVTQEEHNKALAKIVELETKLALNEEGYNNVVIKNKESILNDITFYLDRYLINKMLFQQEDVNDIRIKLISFLDADFKERINSNKEEVIVEEIIPEEDKPNIALLILNNVISKLDYAFGLIDKVIGNKK